VQNEYSLLVRDPEREVLAECEREGLAFLPYFPLASGLLTGKYKPGQPAPPGSRLSNPDSAQRFLSDRRVEAAAALEEFARSRGHTLLELAFSWLLRHRALASVIAGATSPEQVRANTRAAGWRLTADDVAQVDAIVPPAPGGGA
jgi:aryl-alcohol dehydrogenase-like predicted oxidoreductase